MVTKKIVLTGGPGVGKSSIAQNLKNRGYTVRDEVFTASFAKAQAEGRFNPQILHSPELVQELLSDQKRLETLPNQEDLIFLDRSRIDIWIFAKQMGITPFRQDQIDLIEWTPDFVFVVSPMPESYYDQNAVRRQTYSESLEHHRSCIKNYREFLNSYSKGQTLVPLIEVPYHPDHRAASIRSRADFILDQLKNLS